MRAEESDKVDGMGREGARCEGCGEARVERGKGSRCDRRSTHEDQEKKKMNESICM